MFERLAPTTNIFIPLEQGADVVSVFCYGIGLRFDLHTAVCS